VTFDDWAIELKTVNTNLRYAGVEKKKRPITRNTQGVIDDVEKLKKTNYKSKAVLFVAFPAEHTNKKWQRQLQRISSHLSNIDHKEFNFRNRVPGVIYLGII